MDISCIVLAGGRGLRLGRNKVTVTVGSKSLLERVVSRLSFLNTDIIVVTAKKEPLPQSIDYPRLRTVNDIYPGCGSLGGIYTGLVASDSFYNLVVACDMPFLNRRLLSYMVQLADGFDLVIPRFNDMVEPLHAVYSRDCIGPAELLLKQGELQIRQFFPSVRVRYVGAEEVDRFDPGHLSLFNINNEAALRKARDLVDHGEIELDYC